MLLLLCLFVSGAGASEEDDTEPDWRWILIDVYWNKLGGQVCKYRRIGGQEIRLIVRYRGYGCPSKSMNPHNER